MAPDPGGFRLVRGLESRRRPTALAIGNFDGVHRGHVRIVEDLLEGSREAGLAPSLLTFHPHPHVLFAPERPHRQLYSFRQKMECLRAAGLSQVFVRRFDRAFSEVEPEAFLDLLHERLDIRLLILGQDYRFGHKRRGDAQMLREDARRRGHRLVLMDDVAAGGERISSRRIRTLVGESDFASAGALLGRPYRLEGKVVRGDGIGAKVLGFPTINLKGGWVPPCDGVFAAFARIEGARDEIPAALSIGARPAVAGEGPVRIEAHLIGFEGDVYGRHASIRPEAKIREERDYAGMGALREAIAADVEEVSKLLGA